MRSTRLRKFRKKYQPLIIGFRIVLVLYMVLFSVSFLTSDTVAYFDGENVSNIMISAGTWDDEEDEKIEEDETEIDEVEPEDESSLAFVDQDAVENQTCSTQIEVEITNDGDGVMLTEGLYEVYYIENGDPEKDGEKITLEEDEGIIVVLESGDTKKLVYETSNPGFYQFVIFHDEDASEEDRIWSEVIEVICEEEVEAEEESEQESNEEENKEEETTETEETVDEEDPIEEETTEQKNQDEATKEENKTKSDQEENADSDSEEGEESTEEKGVESDEEK